VLVTVGHGTLESRQFVDLLVGAEVDALVDVRRYPGSSRHPHFGREPLTSATCAAGIAYRWDERLGGRRRGTTDSSNVALRNASFRAYADHMRSDEFTAALVDLLDQARRERTALMCSESVWWRCHRRLIADIVHLVHRLDVGHLMHDGKVRPHVPTDGVRRDGPLLVYDAGEVELPLDT
jgi:uncharacterized protein (DUF488 family)